MLFSNFSSRWGWWLLVGATTLWLLWAPLQGDGTVLPDNINLTPMAEHGWALACLLSRNCLFQRRAFWFLLIDVVGNIVVFTPLGFGLAGALYRANLRQIIWLAAVGGFSLSLMIELIQLAIPSRSTDVDDLIFNTLGATTGALCFALLQAGGNKLTDRKATGDS
ncbi:MAG TPA: VanZ family protein [Anaerolineae bacterium]|nr:VanZ family protein [Anaerolineae bacterium]